MHNDAKPEIHALFLDIGGVLLTNGWGSDFRKKAIEKFNLDAQEIEGRHQLAFDNYELGLMTLDEYLDLVVFYEPRPFSVQEFKDFMLGLSARLGNNIEFFKALKEKYKLKVIAVSNEGRELNEYRIKKFGLNELFDAYISSCYVRLHKPSHAILKLACDISQVAPQHALYVDDRALLVRVGYEFGLQTLHFQGIDHAKDFISTCIFQNK